MRGANLSDMKFCGQCRYFSISIQKSTSFFCQELPHKWQVLSESRLQPPLIWKLRLHHHSVTLNISRLSKSDPFTRFVRDCGILPLPEFCSSPGPWSDIGQQWPLVTFVAPVSSVQPGAGKWEDQHLPSKLTRSHLSLPTSQGSEPNVSFSVCYLLFPDIRHHLAT